MLPVMERPLFYWVAYFLYSAAVILCWLRGGRPERLCAGLMLWSHLALGPTLRVNIGDVYIDTIVEDALLFLVFGWLALRSERWWPLVATAAMVLTLVVHACTIWTDISWAAAVSARVGLAILEYVALLAGVAERWMAGETPVSRIGGTAPASRCRQGEPVPPEKPSSLRFS